MKPALSPHTTGLLPRRRTSVLTSVEDARLGDDRAHDLDEVLHRRRVEEVDADHPAGTGVGGGELGDRQRRGVGGQHGRRARRSRRARRKIVFLISIDSTTASTTRSARRASASEVVNVILASSSACSASVIFSRVDRAAGGVLEVLAAAPTPSSLTLDADHGVAVAGEDLGDAGPHRAETPRRRWWRRCGSARSRGVLWRASSSRTRIIVGTSARTARHRVRARAASARGRSCAPAAPGTAQRRAEPRRRTGRCTASQVHARSGRGRPSGPPPCGALQPVCRCP